MQLYEISRETVDLDSNFFLFCRLKELVSLVVLHPGDFYWQKFCNCCTIQEALIRSIREELFNRPARESENKYVCVQNGLASFIKEVVRRWERVWDLIER